MNGGKNESATGSCCIVGLGLKNNAFVTMSVVGDGGKNKTAGKKAVVTGIKEIETNVGVDFIDGGKKTFLSSVSPNGGGSKLKVSP